MSVYLYVILAYLLVLTGYNIYRSRKIKTQEDFMVAGRSLSLTKMVFTLVCTWIGSGTFIAGAAPDEAAPSDARRTSKPDSPGRYFVPGGT